MTDDRPTFVAFDLETTGLWAETDRIIEIGAIRFDHSGKESGRFERLVNPRRPVGASSRAIHGLDDSLLATAEGIESVLPEFLSFLGPADSTLLLAHNAAFDAGFLGAELGRLGLPMPGHAVADTLVLSRRRRPDAPNHRLDSLARLLGLDGEGLHRALADSRRVMDLWLQLDDGEPPTTYPIADPSQNPAPPIPHGWETMSNAIREGLPLTIIYSGGTQGDTPRAISPRRFVRRGGLTYVVAFCHISSRDKEFRLDRVKWHGVMVAPDTIETGARNG
ncbi:exonuclease domain-containing protein [Isosphaeraceae bacterium EP7]